MKLLLSHMYINDQDLSRAPSNHFSFTASTFLKISWCVTSFGHHATFLFSLSLNVSVPNAPNKVRSSKKKKEQGSTVSVDLFMSVVFSLSLKLLPHSDTPQLYYFSTPQPTMKAPCISWPFWLLQLKQWVCLVCFLHETDWLVTPPIQHTASWVYQRVFACDSLY